MPVDDLLQAAGVVTGSPVALAPAAAVTGVAWARDKTGTIPTAELTGVVASALQPRWTWWSARAAAAALVAAGAHVGSCWDLAAVSRLVHGRARDDPAAVWAGAHGLPIPPAAGATLDLLDLDGESGAPVRADGQLSRDWASGSWTAYPDGPPRWAALALEVQHRQEVALRALPEPRRGRFEQPLPVLTARAESAAAVLALELERDGLPVDRQVAAELLTALIGARAVDAAAADAARARRDQRVLRAFPAGDPVDLRNPAQVRGLLERVGLHLPDTRSWRLAPYADTVPAVAALLAWRKAERMATTYGWGWLDRVDDDGRLRGGWSAAEGAGRMTAAAGLHSLPAELRPAVRAQPGWTLVRADLGQVEPRVLAAISGDPALAAAAGEQDMYAPVASRLGCDRATAKVAVLAAMYGQTSGTAGAALAQMERAYPVALAYLREAEAAGREGRDVRTYGGRLLRLSARHDVAPGAAAGWGRFARNAMVQGAAAELFKAWAATVRAELAAQPAQIVLCLHDELLVHAPEHAAADVVRLVRRALQSTVAWWAAGSGVRFVADLGSGRSWVDASA